MDSIYSRKRINIPKIKGFYTKNNNKKQKNLNSLRNSMHKRINILQYIKVN